MHYTFSYFPRSNILYGFLNNIIGRRMHNFRTLCLGIRFRSSNFSVASEFLIENGTKDNNLDTTDASSVNDGLLKLDEINSTKIIEADSVFVSDATESVLYKNKITQLEKNRLLQTKSARDRVCNKVFELFGTPDPSQPVSDVACHGCGALLHCKDPGLFGYLSSQIYLSVPYSHLNNILCQRCQLLKMNKIALDTTIFSENYSSIAKEIKKHSALILLLIDMSDLSNSFHEKFKYLTSIRRPMFIIGNKIDLLYKDTGGYMVRAKKTLIEIARQNGFNENSNVKHFFLVSAKTGFGIEELITRMLNEWRLKGNIFLVGTANSGKSTLFNALLASDFCRSSAKEVINRATTSIWPGTTLNLLKFPIMNPKPSKLYERHKRLEKLSSAVHCNENEETALSNSKHKNVQPHLLSRLGSTYLVPSQMALVTQSPQNVGFVVPSYTQTDIEGKDNLQQVTGLEGAMNYLDVKPLPYNDSTFKYWCFDTPGLINPEQIINLLNQSELLSLVTKKEMKPQIYLMHTGQVLLVSGLGRVEYLQGSDAIYVTVYTSSSVPSHIFNNIQQADDFYDNNIGNPELGIPLGNKERLRNLPSLVGAEFEIEGKGLKETAADIVLSSIGWLAVCSNKDKKITVRAYTPGKRGLLIRRPALIKHPFENMGSRIKGTNRYRVINNDTECLKSKKLK